MSLLDRINQMAADYALSNGFSPDRVIIGPDDREALIDLCVQLSPGRGGNIEIRRATAPPPSGSMLMGMRIELGPKTEVRAARLDLEIAR